MKYCVKNKVEMTQWEIHKLFFWVVLAMLLPLFKVLRIHLFYAIKFMDGAPISGFSTNPTCKKIAEK